MLTLFVLFFSILISRSKNVGELFIDNYAMNLFYSFAFKGMFITLPHTLMAVGYCFVIFNILKNNSKQQLIIILNSICVLILSVSIAAFIYYSTSWFDIVVVSTFTNTMFAVCLLNIILYFTYRLFNRNCDKNKTEIKLQ
jgi:membrane protein YdbS with pleckstrin-like domain